MDNHPPAPPADGLYELPTCCECGQLEDPSSDVPILLCDGCDNECHLPCARDVPKLTEVPEGDWYCSACVQKRTDNTSPQKGNTVSETAPTMEFHDQNGRISPVAQPETSSSPSMKPSMKCIIQGCNKYKQHLAEGYCKLHHTEELERRAGTSEDQSTDGNTDATTNEDNGGANNDPGDGAGVMYVRFVGGHPSNPILLICHILARTMPSRCRRRT